jgi:hypothetical protein
LQLSTRLQHPGDHHQGGGAVLRRSISTGQLTSQVQAEVDQVEGEFDQQRRQQLQREGGAAAAGATFSTANDSCLNKSFEEVLRDQYSFIESDEDFAAQILGSPMAGDEAGGGKADAHQPHPAAGTKQKHKEIKGNNTNERRKEQRKQNDVGELLRILKAGEALAEGDDDNEVQVEHAYFVGWLQKARVFRRLDLTKAQLRHHNVLGDMGTL